MAKQLRQANSSVNNIDGELQENFHYSEFSELDSEIVSDFGMTHSSNTSNNCPIGVFSPGSALIEDLTVDSLSGQNDSQADQMPSSCLPLDLGSSLEPTLEACIVPTPDSQLSQHMVISKKPTSEHVVSPDFSGSHNVENNSTIQASRRRLYKCSKCKKQFSKFLTAKKHCAPFTWKCVDCGTSINKRGNVHRHKRRCAKQKLNNESAAVPTQIETTSVCTFCKLELKNKNTLRSHIYNMHNEKAGILKCTQCIFRCDSERFLKKHMTLKHSDADARKVNCTMCSYTSFSASGLSRHVKKVHLEASSNPEDGDRDIAPSDVVSEEEMSS